ncbi:MAG: hypothetical protein Q8P56_05135 [Candidatus Uhrbacteria bacterium]|nr:hypothetical protein [Candidatus Uhrbacteria bacterium]
MKPVARPSARPVAQKENLYFFAAVFALMLAGDLMWWQTKQISDDFEHSTAGLYSANRSEARELEIIGDDIDNAEVDVEAELRELERIQAEE